jgi:arabinofuranosyltransferase
MKTRWTMPRLLLCVSALLLLCFIYNLFSFWNATVDDSYITARYSENLANGYGLTFSQGFAPVEGYSDPLWMLFLAAVSRLVGPASIMAAAKIASLVCLGAICALFVWVGAHKCSASRSAVTFTVACFVALPGVALWTTGGLETMAYTLAIFAAICFFATDPPQAVPWKAALAIGMACLLRPEAEMFLLAVVISTLYFHNGLGWGRALYSSLAACAIVGVFAASLLSFRLYYFKTFTPNTFLVKAGGSSHQMLMGATYILRTLADPPLALLFLLSLYSCLRYWRRSPVILFSSAVIILQLAFVVWSGGDWMPLYRFVIPLLPAMLFPALLAVRDVEESLSLSRAQLSAASLISIVLLGWHHEYDRYAKLSYSRRLVEGLNTRIALGIWMCNHVGHDKTVAYGDVGALPFFSHLKWIDFNGLVTREVALIRYSDRRDTPQADDAIDRYVLSAHPDYLMLVTARPDPASEPAEYGYHIEEDQEFRENYGYVGALTAYGPGMMRGYHAGRYIQVFSADNPSDREELRSEINCLDSAFDRSHKVDYLVAQCGN